MKSIISNANFKSERMSVTQRKDEDSRRMSMKMIRDDIKGTVCLITHLMRIINSCLKEEKGIILLYLAKRERFE